MRGNILRHSQRRTLTQLPVATCQKENWDTEKGKRGRVGPHQLALSLDVSKDSNHWLLAESTALHWFCFFLRRRTSFSTVLYYGVRPRGRKKPWRQGGQAIPLLHLHPWLGQELTGTSPNISQPPLVWACLTTGAGKASATLRLCSPFIVSFHFVRSLVATWKAS